MKITFLGSVDLYDFDQDCRFSSSVPVKRDGFLSAIKFIYI